MLRIALLAVLLLASAAPTQTVAAGLERVKYNHPGLVVDLGVGLWGWPLPMDYDGDGDLDLIVSCSDVPYRGTYFFENPGGDKKMPVFKPGVRIGTGIGNITLSYVDGKPRVLVPGAELTGFATGDLDAREKIYKETTLIDGGRVRANQWSYVDYDGDSAVDLIVGHGHWADYGWDNAFNAEGQWTRGPLHGCVYLLHNKGTTAKPDYEAPKQLTTANDLPIDVFGMPSPIFADFDGDGDLDLLCGSFIDDFTYFQNTGSRTAVRYAPGKKLTQGGNPLTMQLCMIVVSAIDWDGDGDTDLIVGQEDGRVAFIEHTGRVAEGMPVFAAPRFFQQQAEDVKFGALVTPVSFDWDGDGDEDLICGNTAGEIGFIENLGGHPPKWAAPKLLEADGRPIRIMAGPNGSIQGPAEAKWGYTTLDVGDWDRDGLPDVIANSIWGKVVWHRNIGSRRSPQLAAAQPVEVQWRGKPPKPAWNWWEPRGRELATQWRTTPVIADWDGDGLSDLVMLDHEGYLALFRLAGHDGKFVLQPGERIFLEEGKPLRLNAGTAGKSGRRKLCLIDWDGDGRRDLLVNSINVNFYRNIGEADGKATFADMGAIDSRRLAGHTTSPTTVDWDGDGVRDLLVGAEDGYLYHMPYPGKGGTRLSVSATLDSLDIHGQGFTIQTLDEGGKAYGNRDYTWYDVPASLRGRRFTRTNGGEHATIYVTAKTNTTIYFATGASRKESELTGWVKSDSLSFGYTDAGKTRMAVFSRAVKAGERIEIPQGNWTGGIVLTPPGPEAAQGKPDEKATGANGRSKQINVLFIGVDDMRNDVGCYGHPIVKSPNIDGLAARGTLFTRAYCQQAVCNPTRASLLTGLRPSTLGIWDLPTHFRQRMPDLVTLPQAFKQQGYFTQNIGKIFHNWVQDDFKGDALSWSVPAVMHYNNHGADKPQIQAATPEELAKTPRCEMRDVPDEAYFDGRIAAMAVKALGEMRDREEPWFLAVGFWKPHAPFNAPKKYWDLYDRDKVDLPANPDAPRGVPAIALHDSREILRGFKGQHPTTEEVRTLRHGYYAAISYVDAQIGKLVDELDRLGLADNTVIVFWSDHGYHLGEQTLWAKTSNFELDARVPLIIVTPRQKGGKRSDSLVELLDLYPTLTDLCGVTAPKLIEGKSLRPVLGDPKAIVKSAAFTWHPRPAYPVNGEDPQVMGYSMRTDHYRYTEWRDFATGKPVARELYDHDADPRETVNLIDRADLPDTVAALAKQMAATHPRGAVKPQMKE